MASSGVHSMPKRSRERREQQRSEREASVPPVMYTDIARPGRSPPSLCASAAAGGWKAAPPSPPAIRIPRASASDVGGARRN